VCLTVRYRERQNQSKANRRLEKKNKEYAVQVDEERARAEQFKNEVCVVSRPHRMYRTDAAYHYIHVCHTFRGLWVYVFACAIRYNMIRYSMLY